MRTFARQPDGSYHAPPGVADTLAVTSGAHVLTQADGSALRYDGDGRLVALVSDDGNETTVGYDQDGRLATVTAPGGRWLEVTIAATPHGDRVTRVEAADGRAVAYGYDGDGRLQTVTDVRGEVWTYRYDGAGRLDRVTDPLGAHVHTTSQSPYVRWQQNGQPLDVHGNKLPTAHHPDAHLPLQDFRFLPGLFQ